MKASILARVISNHPVQLLSLCISLYGILVLNWLLFPVIFLFWWEIILSLGAALVRTLFALEGRSFFHSLPLRLFLIVAGIALGFAILALAISFSIKGMDIGKTSISGLGSIPSQVNILIAGTVLNLIINYFYNGKYREAQPFQELMKTYSYMIILLSLLMVLTMHIIPSYPQLSEAKWIAASVVLIKSTVDWMYYSTLWRKSWQQMT